MQTIQLKSRIRFILTFAGFVGLIVLLGLPSQASAADTCPAHDATCNGPPPVLTPARQRPYVTNSADSQRPSGITQTTDNPSFEQKITTADFSCYKTGDSAGDFQAVAATNYAIAICKAGYTNMGYVASVQTHTVQCATSGINSDPGDLTGYTWNGFMCVSDIPSPMPNTQVTICSTGQTLSVPQYKYDSGTEDDGSCGGMIGRRRMSYVPNTTPQNVTSADLSTQSMLCCPTVNTPSPPDNGTGGG